MKSPQLLAALAVLVVGSLPAQAAVTLASPFTDHMVLQRDQPVPIWGKSSNGGDQVTVRFNGQTVHTTADGDGRWRVRLAPMSAGGPYELVVDPDTPDQARVEDVLIGEVWLASGQSNMDFTVAKTPKYFFAGVNHESAEVAEANYPQLRMFTGAWSRTYDPQTEVVGTWKICTPESVREFSAIAYFFARDLQQALNVPVGIVTLTYGASTAQAWIRREAIAADPRLKPTLDAFDARVKTYTPPTEAEMAQWQAVVDQAKASGQRPPRGSRPHPNPVSDQHNPTVLYNGMIAPFVPYAIRGIIWYQGESITGPHELFPVWNETLINDWRQLWGSELPFYFCQLSAQEATSNNPDIRELQAQALSLPATAMVVTVDIGDRHNVHPKNKQDVGDRLTRIALAKVYGQKIECYGPWYESAAVEGGTLRLSFSHLGGGLVARGGPLKTFEIAGSDGKYVVAEAKIDGDTIVVSAPTVPAPTAARYAWSAYPDGCNLYNAAGLPAAPFRTDHKIAVAGN
jgi:sialate O-acetylesterase